MQRRAVLAAIASLPGVTILSDSSDSILDPNAQEIIGRAIERPESVGHEVLRPLENLIMGCRHLDDVLGSRYLTEPVNGIIQIFGDLLPAAEPGVRQSLFSLAANAAQLAGWLALDRGDDDRARAFYSQALEWATAADDVALVAYLWGCRSEQAWIIHNPVEAVSNAEAARRTAASQDKTLQAWVETKAGRAYALAGNVQETTRAMEQAATLLGEEAQGATYGWLYHFHEENMIASHGSALTRVGQGKKAVELLSAALDSLAPTYVRERGILLAYQADAFRAIGDPEQASSIGAQAVIVGRQTGSDRTIKLIRQLHRSLDGKSAELPAVRSLRDLLETASGN